MRASIIVEVAACLCLVVAACNPAGNQGKLQVNSTPTGADIWLDGANTGQKTNFLFSAVEQGLHVVELRLSEYRTWKDTITLDPGKTVTIDADLQTTTGALSISSVPSGAAVWFNDLNTGKTTACLLESLVEGQYPLTLKLAGYQDWSATVSVTSGDTVTVSANLVALTTGWLRVNSTPAGAAVWLDGTNTGETTNCLISGVYSGWHDLTLGLNGYYSWDTSVSVIAGDTLVVTAALEPKPETSMVYIGPNAQGYEEYLWLRDSMLVIKIPAGVFTMGSTTNPDEEPVHTIFLDEYYCDKYEVTNRQYRKFCDATGRNYPSDPGFPGMPNYFTNYPTYPVVKVGWTDAAAYANWVGRALATEAQWEKAARGTDSRTWPWGNQQPDTTLCNWDAGDPYVATSPVGAFPAGASYYGAMDMAGNVWEWGKDWYSSSYYSVSPDSNPPGPTSGTDRIARGGSYNNDDGVWLRCAERYWGPPTGGAHPALGFRCATVRP